MFSGLTPNRGLSSPGIAISINGKDFQKQVLKCVQTLKNAVWMLVVKISN